MTSRWAAKAIVAAVAVVLGACGGDISYDASTDGLEKLAGDMMTAVRDGDTSRRDAIGQSLVLPDHEAWFVAHFGEARGKRIAAEYAPIVGQIGMVWQFFQQQIDRGRTKITASRHDKPDDPAATGLQQAVLKASSEPLTVYTLRFVEPDKARGSALWNFVHDGRTFRFVGKMRKVRDKESTKVLDRAFDELPVEDFKASMKKGLGR